MSRAEGAGLAGAVVVHALLGWLLWLGAQADAKADPQKPVNAPIEVSLSEDVADLSQAPVPHQEEVAAKLSPVEAPTEPEVAPPDPAPAPDPQPVAKPQPAPPKPAPAPKAQPAPPKPVTKAQPAPKQPATRPAPARPAARPQPRRDVRASGALDGIVAGLASRPTTGTATTPPATTAGPQVRSALRAEVLRQIKPHWTPPSGADSDQLRTRVLISLNRDGSIAGAPRVTQTGVTASNRVQADLHRERAIRAVRLAAPFKLPAQYYDAWKTIAPVLYEDL